MVVVVTEFARQRVISELLYVDKLVLMSETIEDLRNEFLKQKTPFESKGLNVYIENTKVMVSSGITKDVLP